MIANSLPLTTTLFGNSSGVTKESLTSTIELATTQILQEQVITKLNVRLPRLPSNQKIATEKGPGKN